MSISARMQQLHHAYLMYRNTAVPFPVESVIAWYFLLALQNHYDIRGDILEMGVEHGGTAFLAAVALDDTEDLVLVDLKKSPRFTEKADMLPAALRARLDFHECSTKSQALNDVASRKYRFLHIDAGHSREDVCDDFNRFADCTAVDGLLCLDDVFEIRWPGVTEAVLECVPGSAFEPVFFVNRKLYLAHKDSASLYRTMLETSLSALNDFGQVRVWKEKMMGADTVIAKVAPHTHDLAKLV